MPKIIVPTDFSPTAENAMDYAFEIAKSLNHTLKLVHIYTPMGVSLDDAAYVAHTEIRTEFEQKLKNRIKKLNSRQAGEGIPQLESEMEFGFPARKITEMSREEEVSMVIMGSTGATGAFEKIFGKVSTDVALHAHCPVLLVPDGYGYKGIHKILYSAKYSDLDHAFMPYLAKFAKSMGCTITLLHNKVDESDEYTLNELKDLLAEESPDVKATTELVHDDDFAKVINEYVKEREFDLVFLASKQRAFFERILKTSIVRQMAFSTEIPLCILHQEGHRFL